MPHQRTTLLLILLVITPIALLAWLGTYLLRDAARSTDNAMAAILTERLAAADHQLTSDLSRVTEQLDTLAAEVVATPTAAAEALARHPWTAETWVVQRAGPVVPVANKGRFTPHADAAAEARADTLRLAVASLPPGSADNPSQSPFRSVNGTLTSLASKGRPFVWQTFVRSSGHDDFHSLSRNVAELQRPSGWHVTDRDFIYWRLTESGDVCCARLDSGPLREGLFARLPTPGLPMYPGTLTLTTASGIPLHTWGLREGQADDVASAHRFCSGPLTQWLLAYTPAPSEFPKPYLFPILLGVGSGCLLVLTLAWMFFNENERELRVAQQRVSFVNQISHELKTPLTNIQLYTEMASHRLEHTDDQITKRHLTVVETETARLNRLIQNVLNYARQQRDQLSVQPRTIALDEVVERAVGHWRPLLECKGFVVDLKLNGPAAIQADADAIEQILGNLLSNVDKYGSAGKWVSVRTQTVDSKTQVVVEDRGPGIPASKRNSVFEAFSRLRSDLNEGVSGTGIGLTISRELAELHGGTLEVCSHYREGARFILTLPLQSS